MPKCTVMINRNARSRCAEDAAAAIRRATRAVAEKNLECKLEVRHVNETGIGARIVAIDQKGSDLCQLYLQEQYADRLNRSG